MTTFLTCGCCERAMTLYDFVLGDANQALNVVNVLGVIGQKTALIFEKLDESVGRCKLWFARRLFRW